MPVSRLALCQPYRRLHLYPGPSRRRAGPHDRQPHLSGRRALWPGLVRQPEGDVPTVPAAWRRAAACCAPSRSMRPPRWWPKTSRTASSRAQALLGSGGRCDRSWNDFPVALAAAGRRRRSVFFVQPVDAGRSVIRGVLDRSSRSTHCRASPSQRAPAASATASNAPAPAEPARQLDRARLRRGLGRARRDAGPAAHAGRRHCASWSSASGRPPTAIIGFELPASRGTCRPSSPAPISTCICPTA